MTNSVNNMYGNDSTVPAPRKVMTMFYVIDTSGSMDGQNIQAVNQAMHSAGQLLSEISKKNNDAEIKVAVLEFNNGASWGQYANGPISAEKFTFNDLTASGGTDLEAALYELDDKLSKNKFLKSQTGSYKPVIIFMSDGMPNSGYEKALEKINKNDWFKHGIKLAININGDSDVNVLAELAGSSECIIDSSNPEALLSTIKFASVRASEFQSHSRRACENSDDAVENSINIANQVKEDLKEQDAVPQDVTFIDI